MAKSLELRPNRLRELSPNAIRGELRRAFVRRAGEDAREPEIQIAAAVAQAGVEPPFTLCAGRHVRHWVDGLVIGSELFVRETMRYVRPASLVTRHRLARAETLIAGELAVCCWRRLRVMRI